MANPLSGRGMARASVLRAPRGRSVQLLEPLSAEPAFGTGTTSRAMQAQGPEPPKPRPPDEPAPRPEPSLPVSKPPPRELEQPAPIRKYPKPLH